MSVVYHLAITHVSKHLRVKWSVSQSVLSISLWPHGLSFARLFCPWDSPGKNVGGGCRFLLQGIFLTRGLNLGLWWLRWWSVRPPCGRPRFDPWVGKIPWRRKWPPIQEFLPGKSHGLRNLVGYSPWGCKESDMTERLHFLLHCRQTLLSEPPGKLRHFRRWNLLPRSFIVHSSLKLKVQPSVLFFFSPHYVLCCIVSMVMSSNSLIFTSWICNLLFFFH